MSIPRPNLFVTDGKYQLLVSTGLTRGSLSWLIATREASWYLELVFSIRHSLGRGIDTLLDKKGRNIRMENFHLAHCHIGIWENWVPRGTAPILASGNSLVSIWSFLLGLLLGIAVHHYDLSRWNLYFGQNYFLVSITLGVLIHQLPFRGYYWPRNTHLDILDELPWEMQTQNFWKKSLGTIFFYFSNSSKNWN